MKIAIINYQIKKITAAPAEAEARRRFVVDDVRLQPDEPDHPLIAKEKSSSSGFTESSKKYVRHFGGQKRKTAGSGEGKSRSRGQDRISRISRISRSGQAWRVEAAATISKLHIQEYLYIYMYIYICIHIYMYKAS